jgi:hypothetical protein
MPRPGSVRDIIPRIGILPVSGIIVLPRSTGGGTFPVTVGIQAIGLSRPGRIATIVVPRSTGGGTFPVTVGIQAIGLSRPGSIATIVVPRSTGGGTFPVTVGIQAIGLSRPGSIATIVVPGSTGGGTFPVTFMVVAGIQHRVAWEGITWSSCLLGRRCLLGSWSGSCFVTSHRKVELKRC